MNGKYQPGQKVFLTGGNKNLIKEAAVPLRPEVSEAQGLQRLRRGGVDRRAFSFKQCRPIPHTRFMPRRNRVILNAGL